MGTFPRPVVYEYHPQVGPLSQDSVDHRVACAESWLDAAQSVAADAPESNAPAIMRSVHQFLAVAVPIAYQARYLPSVRLCAVANTTKHIDLVPVLPEDARRLPVYDARIPQAQGTEFPSFNGLLNNIHLPAVTPATERGRGLMMTTMLFRGLAHLTGEFVYTTPDRDPDRYWLQELESYDFEANVLAHLGGALFTDVVQAFYDKMNEEKTMLLRDPDAIVHGHRRKLRRIFGRSMGVEERAIWGGLAKIKAQFIHCRTKHPDDPQAGNAEIVAFLRSIDR